MAQVKIEPGSEWDLAPEVLKKRSYNGYIQGKTIGDGTFGEVYKGLQIEVCMHTLLLVLARKPRSLVVMAAQPWP